MKTYLLFILTTMIIWADIASADDANKDNSATIYFYREGGKISGSLQEAWLYVDGLKIAEIGTNEYVAYHGIAGKHTIEVRGDQTHKKNSAPITLKKNETIYLKADATAGKGVTALVMPYMDEGLLKSFGIFEVDSNAFNKAKPKLKSVQEIIYTNAPIDKDPSLGHIYIYRGESGVNNGVQTALIFHNKHKISNLDDQQYLVLSVKEGKHTLEVRGIENTRKDKIELTVQAQKNYYYTLETNSAHKATYAVLPILDTVVSKAFNFVAKDQDEFEAVKDSMGRLDLDSN